MVWTGDQLYLYSHDPKFPYFLICRENEVSVEDWLDDPIDWCTKYLKESKWTLVSTNYKPNNIKTENMSAGVRTYLLLEYTYIIISVIPTNVI